VQLPIQVVHEHLHDVIVRRRPIDGPLGSCCQPAYSGPDPGLQMSITQ
jgi:hypothetical protein